MLNIVFKEETGIAQNWKKTSWSLITNYVPACRCPNLAVKEAEDDETVEESDVPEQKSKKVAQTKRKKQTQCKLSWIGEPVQVCFTLIGQIVL